MYIIYSLHAEEQIKIRRLHKIWIEEAIKSPDFTQKEVYKKYLIRKKLNGRAIEVVYVRESYIKVITVYWL